MTAPVKILIHSSQFPENVRRDLLASLRARKINHKFHYDSVKQTQKWLELHQQFSPSRRDDDVRAIYMKSFEAAATKMKSKSIHLIGLGCGGGQKDTRLLKLLKEHGKKVFYTPCDVSAAMVLTAFQTAREVLPAKNCFPAVCDLATANDLPETLVSRHPSLVTFFGMIPNFDPSEILPKLASLIRPKDFLLFSANLSPGKDYGAGVKKILPQYDNELTREWLMTFLTDLGIEKSGELKLKVENGCLNLKRIAACFNFHRRRQIKIDGEIFRFRAGEKIRLFFSYRHTPALVKTMLARHALEICGEWIADSEEEGVFLCQKSLA